MQNSKSTLSFDMNCDLGEGMGNEAEIMPYISSCSIACGGHVGDDGSMREAVALATLHGVKIGAHPSYPDKENFGRVKISISDKDLLDHLVSQTTELQKIVRSLGGELHHIKPHGALYNFACVDAVTAAVVVKLIEKIDKNLILYAPYHSVLANLAMENNIQVMHEAFADRNYSDDGSLLSRELNRAVITDPAIAVKNVLSMLKDGVVNTISGKKIPIQADTICIHSDTDNAAGFVADFYKQCLAAGLHIQ
jgi:UPF0271 protein